MTNKDNASGDRISNWTLATGTKPGERYVYPITTQRNSPTSDPGGRS